MSVTRRGSNLRPLPQRRPEPPLVLPLQEPDRGFIFALLALFSVGLVMMYSVSAVGGGTGEIGRLLLNTGVAVACLVVAIFIPVSWWKYLTPLILVLCMGALISLEIPGNPLALTVKGATRWLRLPGGMVLQPSEFTKLALVLFAARLFSARDRPIHGGQWALFGGVLLLLGGLIYKEPDLGTALVLAGTAFCLLLAAGAQWKWLISGTLVAAALVFWLAWHTPHQQVRLLAWADPWAEDHRWDGGHQVIQSWAAMARGGWWGVGLGQSIQKLDNRLPESENDFIFAIVAEELGLVRAVGVLLLFAIFIWRGFAVAARAPDRYTALVAAGVASWVAVQSILNIAVVTGTVPNTGVPLPFISMGGSSLTALLLACGIVIGISRLKRVELPLPAVSAPKAERAVRGSGRHSDLKRQR